LSVNDQKYSAKRWHNLTYMLRVAHPAITITCKVDEMIRMIDRDGDGQVGFAEFHSMVAREQKQPPGLWEGGKYPSSKGRTLSPPPPTGSALV